VTDAELRAEIHKLRQENQRLASDLECALREISALTVELSLAQGRNPYAA
jgi:hypothetical protein